MIPSRNVTYETVKVGKLEVTVSSNGSISFVDTRGNTRKVYGDRDFLDFLEAVKKGSGKKPEVITCPPDPTISNIVNPYVSGDWNRYEEERVGIVRPKG